MPQPTIDLVRKLESQFRQFQELCASFGSPLQVNDLAFSISLSYLTQRFTVQKSGSIYFQIALQRNTLADIYYNDVSKLDPLKKHFEPLFTEFSPDLANPIDHTYENYLLIAESIARVAYLCAAGDDYYPGYFSEIIIQEEGTTLRQNNHMNSRSLDHKQNYSLRDLEFFIPRKKGEPSRGLNWEFIGEMCFNFDDRSSANNKHCGDRIREKIREEQDRFRKISS